MLIRNFLNIPLKDEVIHEGEGLCRHAMVFGDSDIQAPVRFINYTVLPPKASFGIHRHGNDNEFYVVLSGEGVYYQDGEEQCVSTGDIMMNSPHGAHGIRNTGDTDMALIVFECEVKE